jgi:hypothetical protein
LFARLLALALFGRISIALILLTHALTLALLGRLLFTRLTFAHTISAAPLFKEAGAIGACDRQRFTAARS